MLIRSWQRPTGLRCRIVVDRGRVRIYEGSAYVELTKDEVLRVASDLEFSAYDALLEPKDKSHG